MLKAVAVALDLFLNFIGDTKLARSPGQLSQRWFRARENQSRARTASDSKVEMVVNVHELNN